MVAFMEVLEDTPDAIPELTSCLNTSSLLELARRFSDTYTHLAKNSTEHFLVTPVTALPNGKEQGKYLAIDVGGSNLRVGFVELAAKSVAVESQTDNVDSHNSANIKRSHDKSWPIGDHLKTDRPEDLFTWIGDCIAEVIEEAINDTSISASEEVLMGVTFSFPMAQSSLSEATLLPMGKGFAITTDLNLGEMLLAGYARHCSPSPETLSHGLLPKIRVAAITNDTVATFISSAYAVKATPNSRVTMGLIVGTGTNATVPMQPSTLHPSKTLGLHHPNTVETIVINTEWTIRGTDAPLEALSIKTVWDRVLDQGSDVPGFQPFEYMTSGRYLGEIVRLAFIDSATSPLDTHQVPSSLQTRHALPTRFLSEFVARSDEISLRALLAKKYPSSGREIHSFWTQDRVQLLRDLARAVQQRSSALIAAASVGLLACVGDIQLAETDQQQTSTPDEMSDSTPVVDELVIAYTGSTISQYPNWLQDCQMWIDELVAASGLNGGKSVVLREALDGGIVGAAVLAGMADARG